MKINITGKGIELTQGLKDAVTSKLSKLEKMFTKDAICNVTLSVEKERQKIEVTIPVKGHIIRSEQESDNMYVSIDLVEEVIERQLKKYKNKIIDKKQNAGDFADEFVDEYEDEGAPGDGEEVEIIQQNAAIAGVAQSGEESQQR